MSSLQIVTTPEGRALEYDGQQAPLPALPVDATVHAYSVADGLWVGVQALGEPRPVYPGSGGVKLGAVELEADASAVAKKAADTTRQRLTGVVQQHMDTVAQRRNYDGILSLCTYATSAHLRFATEGQAGVEWRDSVWALGYQLLDEALAGERDIPSDAELIALLPEMQWPN